MENWTEAWRPQVITPYSGRVRYKTLITPFESGKEQRRQKQTKGKNGFTCSWNALDKTTYFAIKAFFEARGGAYETFNFPNYGQYIKGTRLSIDATADEIADSSSEFKNFGFDANYGICISDSVEGNDGYYSLSTVADSTLSITGNVGGNNESANEDLRVYKVYSMRFLNDTFQSVVVAPGYYGLSFELLEVF